jgi:hypothetical protein
MRVSNACPDEVLGDGVFCLALCRNGFWGRYLIRGYAAIEMFDQDARCVGL